MSDISGAFNVLPTHRSSTDPRRSTNANANRSDHPSSRSRVINSSTASTSTSELRSFIKTVARDLKDLRDDYRCFKDDVAGPDFSLAPGSVPALKMLWEKGEENKRTIASVKEGQHFHQLILKSTNDDLGDLHKEVVELRKEFHEEQHRQHIPKIAPLLADNPDISTLDYISRLVDNFTTEMQRMKDKISILETQLRSRPCVPDVRKRSFGEMSDAHVQHIATSTAESTIDASVEQSTTDTSSTSGTSTQVPSLPVNNRIRSVEPSESIDGMLAFVKVEPSTDTSSTSTHVQNLPANKRVRLGEQSDSTDGVLWSTLVKRVYNLSPSTPMNQLKVLSVTTGNPVLLSSELRRNGYLIGREKLVVSEGSKAYRVRREDVDSFCTKLLETYPCLL